MSMSTDTSMHVAQCSAASSRRRYFCNLVRDNGALPLSEFVQACLYDRRYGYYACSDVVGPQGDFITAPEISSMFGEIVASWLIALWEKNWADEEALTLVEAGAGSGVFLADILGVIRRLMPDLYAKLHVEIIEYSSILVKRQARNLAGFISPDDKQQRPLPIVWRRRIEDISEATHPLLLLGNEFLDCFPVDQWHRKNGLWYKRHVGWSPQRCDLVHFENLNPPFKEAFLGKGEPREGDMLEYSRQRNDFLRSFALCIKDRPALAWFCDYGYADGAFNETLQAVRDHKQVDLLRFPGICDLSAHVDFSALSALAQGLGLRVLGPVAQGQFLKNCGLLLRLAAVCSRQPQKAEAAQKAVHRLVDPDAMGKLFMVICLSNYQEVSADGFDPPDA